jgi:NADH-quinone oxidoreductase subunit C
MNEPVKTRLRATFPKVPFEFSEFRDELTVVLPKENIVEVCSFLKKDPDTSFDLLADLCGIDMYTPLRRFGVIYNLYSLSRKHRIRLKAFVEGEEPRIATVSGVWRTAILHERETFDMFGIIFEGHSDLRRVYMPDEYEHHPLRKDFPLMGIPGSLELPKK